MEALVIPISSEESVGSHVLRVILFGTIPTSILVILAVPPKVPIAHVDLLVVPNVGAVYVISPTILLDLVDYPSSFDSDPSEDCLHITPELPLVSPFLCSDNSEADSESEPAEQKPKRHKPLVPLSEFPLTLVVTPPKIHQRPTILVLPDRHSLPDFKSDSSSSGSSSDSSSDIYLGSSLDSLSDSPSVRSSGCDALGQSHSGPSSRVASPRLVYPPVRTP
nr:hypothetical protein [Tanacetum cinerariifolium]